MAEYLYRLQLVRPQVLDEGPSPAEGKTLAAHGAYLEQLAAKGLLRLAGRTQQDGARTFGIVILRGIDEDRAASIMAGDPAVRDSLMRAELFPFTTAVEG